MLARQVISIGRRREFVLPRCKRVKREAYWKHEFANHRLLYQTLPEEKKIVVVCAVGPRKAGDAADIYFQLNKVVASGRLAEQVTSILETILPGLRKKKKK
jgi:hypothetical protein